jgi:uncharacterized membrane protein YsdA (DUF1294 family)
MPNWTLVVLAIFGLMSLITFVTFGWDKRAAIKKRRRVPERRLHQLELAGGWPGALVGMQLFRHKRAKPAYKRVTWGIVALHIASGAVALWWHLR